MPGCTAPSGAPGRTRTHSLSRPETLPQRRRSGPAAASQPVRLVKQFPELVGADPV